MIIKNYHQPKGEPRPALDIQIIEDITDVLIYASVYSADKPMLGAEEAGVTSLYGGDNQTSNRLNRHIDFTRNGVRSRLVVTDYAYICNDQGKTVEKVST